MIDRRPSPDGDRSALDATVSRALTYSGRLSEALDALAVELVLFRRVRDLMTPAAAERVAGNLWALRDHLDRALASLAATPKRPAPQGLLRKQANR